MTADLQRCWVAGVVRDEDGNFLVVRSGQSQAWDLPAGVLRQGEDPVQGLRRVVSELPEVSCRDLYGLRLPVESSVVGVFVFDGWDHPDA